MIIPQLLNSRFTTIHMTLLAGLLLSSCAPVEEAIDKKIDSTISDITDEIENADINIIPETPTNTDDPAAPVSPVEPVNPIVSTNPGTPVGHIPHGNSVTPVDPVVVLDPGTPVAHVPHTNPVVPVDPVVVVDPAQPVDPVVITDPGIPVAHVPHTNPVVPVDPVAVIDPAVPVDPVAVINPAQPADPVTPIQTASTQLTWIAPSEREDASPLSLSEIAGYKIYYGTEQGSYNNTVTVSDSTAMSYNLTGLSTGTYYIVVTTYDTSGRESQYSTEVTVNV